MTPKPGETWVRKCDSKPFTIGAVSGDTVRCSPTNDAHFYKLQEFLRHYVPKEPPVSEPTRATPLEDAWSLAPPEHCTRLLKEIPTADLQAELARREIEASYAKKAVEAEAKRAAEEAERKEREVVVECPFCLVAPIPSYGCHQCAYSGRYTALIWKGETT